MVNESKDWAKFKAEHDADSVESAEETEEQHVAQEPELPETNDTNHSGGALEHPSYEELEAQLLTIEQKSQENWEKAVRAKAELENVRRQAQRDVENAHKFGTSKLIESLIPVIDSLEQALTLAIQNDDQPMQEGLELTLKVFMDTLTKQGVVQIDPIGEIFNPERHEAMTMQPNKEVANNTVLTVFQKGYELNGRVIRAARVVVAQNK